MEVTVSTAPPEALAAPLCSLEWKQGVEGVTGHPSLFFVFVGLYLQHMEAPRLEAESEP